RQHGEARLGLHGTERVGDQEGVELRIESPRHGKDPVRSGEIDDLGVLEDVDTESKTGRLRLLRHGVLRRNGPAGKSMPGRWRIEFPALRSRSKGGRHAFATRAGPRSGPRFL